MKSRLLVRLLHTSGCLLAPKACYFLLLYWNMINRKLASRLDRRRMSSEAMSQQD